jgi:hypothetical protein
MKLSHTTYFLMTMIFFAACGKLDNHPAPDAGVKGNVIDAVTKEPLQTEQPNGVKIRMLEMKYQGNVSPQDIWTRANGTFETTQLFAGAYKIVPVEGPFFNADTTQITVNGITDISFTVTPFLNVQAQATTLGNSIVLTYTISRPKAQDKIVECKSLLSAYPSVSNPINERAVTHDLSGIDDNTILSNKFSDTLTALQSGQTYYVRVAARTANAYNKYNYTKVMEVKIQ